MTDSQWTTQEWVLLLDAARSCAPEAEALLRKLDELEMALFGRFTARAALDREIARLQAQARDIESRLIDHQRVAERGR